VSGVDEKFITLTTCGEELSDTDRGRILALTE
jgi:hypothetical protein